MAPHTIRWGILATGGIAQTFTKDLLLDPKTRGVNNVVHTVTAAASTSGAVRAKAFLEEAGAPAEAKAYGSYEELANDKNVDIIYIATPHSHHFQNAMLCLEAGKNVLCEKALTVNAAQARKLVEKAKEKNLFFMEAVWTRYMPIALYVRDIITSGKLGNVTRVSADNSVNFNPRVNFKDGSHRLVNPDLAGGALLDLGIYALSWIFQTLYETQPPSERKPPKVSSFITPYGPTGVDETTSILLEFPRPDGRAVHGIATTSLSISSSTGSPDVAVPAVRVYGDNGELQIWAPVPRPTKTRLLLKDGTVENKEFQQPGPGAGSGWYNGFAGHLNPEGVGQGMFWEADEAGIALIEGRKESRLEGLEESIAIMDVMDEVRRQNNFRFPESIETTKYP